MKINITDKAKWAMKEQLSAALAANPKSKIAWIIWLLPELEAALANGHTCADCIQVLETCGLKFTYEGFKKTIQRARKMPTARKALIVGDMSGNGHEPAERQTANLPAKGKAETARQEQSNGKVKMRYVAGVPFIEIADESSGLNPIPDLDELI